jgi:hypothetical protein
MTDPRDYADLPMTVEQVVTKLIHAGFQDHGMGDYGDSVVQATFDGETFYSLVGPIDYSDGGVVFELRPFPQGCHEHDRVRCRECLDRLLDETCCPQCGEAAGAFHDISCPLLDDLPANTRVGSEP